MNDRRMHGYANAITFDGETGMRRILTTLTLGSVLLSGCYVYPARERVVDREVVDQNGNVIERDRVYPDDGPPPPPRVEVVPVAPYFGAVWVPGLWYRGPHRWYWTRGHWR
jgi:hypothetical protein